MSALILVVDDDERSRRLAVDVLRHEGHIVVACVSGEEALEQIQAQRPDLVLLDIQMAGISGLDVLAWLRASAQYAGLPVIAMTASVKLAQEDFAAFLPKPLSIRHMVATVHRHLDPAKVPKR